jgi:hypothetical protein
MKTLQKLKMSWDILLSIYTMYAIISTALLLVALFFNDLPNINGLFGGNTIQSIDNYIRIIVVLMAVGNIMYIIVLFKLKKLIDLFMKNDFFSNASILLLKQIGTYLSYSTLLIYIPTYFYNLFINHQNTTGVFAQSLDKTAFLFFTLLGVFFLILSAVFEEAKRLKEENDLMI